MLVFLDTEFHPAHRHLLSVGAVSAVGGQFYAELEMAHALVLAGRHRFLKEQVLPQFGRTLSGVHALRSTRAADLARGLLSWLDAQRAGLGSVHLAYDASIDVDLLEDALGATLPAWVEPCNLAILNTEPAAEAARQACWTSLAPRGIGRHHALADAWALRRAYEAQSGAS